MDGPILRNFLYILIVSAVISGCVPEPVYHSNQRNKRTVKRPQKDSITENGEPVTGIASFYADKFHGRKTANGEIFDQNKMTAAHRTYPFGTVVQVTSLANGKSVEVRINDRGPFVKGRIIDLSRSAAKEIGMIGAGTAKVEIRVIRLGE